ncbi:MAG: hypothetical protein HYV67_02635 [Candidatus Taylorbacteria bacterium]|nr:hypothetical protein [Candidatus Taylorbacteria bacterium]
MLSCINKADENTLRQIQEEMALRKIRELFILFGMGSQTDGLIMNLMSVLGVFCLQANPKTMTAADVLKLRKVGLIGMIGSGGPYSVYSTTEPVPFDSKIFETKVPFFGICLSFQMWANHLGARVIPAKVKDFNPSARMLVLDKEAPLFKGLPASFVVAQSHSDEILEFPGIHITARSETGHVAAAEAGHLHGIQGHPEMSQSEYGRQILGHFCRIVCDAKDRFPVADVAAEKIQALRKRIDKKKVVVPASGGADSSVALELLREALGENAEQIRVVYIAGLDMEDGAEKMRRRYGGQSWCELRIVDATEQFLAALKGKTEQGEKRLAMQSVYTSVIEEHIRDFGAGLVVHGTIYPDISESGFSLADLAENGIELSEEAKRTMAEVSLNVGARKAEIKRHHNMGNNFTVPELIPLANMVKDTVRELGRTLKIKEEILMQHPFPGPGLSVFIEGEFTLEKRDMARAANRIWIEEIRRIGKYEEIWQAQAEVTESFVTCAKGDEKGKGRCIRLCAAVSVNGFTATPYLFDMAFVVKVSTRIVNEVKGAGVCDYKTTTKPPATIVCG